MLVADSHTRGLVIQAGRLPSSGINQGVLDAGGSCSLPSCKQARFLKSWGAAFCGTGTSFKEK